MAVRRMGGDQRAGVAGSDEEALLDHAVEGALHRHGRDAEVLADLAACRHPLAGCQRALPHHQPTQVLDDGVVFDGWTGA